MGLRFATTFWRRLFSQIPHEENINEFARYIQRKLTRIQTVTILTQVEQALMKITCFEIVFYSCNRFIFYAKIRRVYTSAKNRSVATDLHLFTLITRAEGAESYNGLLFSFLFFLFYFVLSILHFERWLVRGTFADSSSHVRPVNQNKWRRAIWNINAYA